MVCVSLMSMNSYLPRLVDGEIAENLDLAGAVYLRGPRACGKTSSARLHAKSEVRLDQDAAARAQGQLDSRVILDGAQPRLIDEWQLVPESWDAVRGAVDDAGTPGQFLLTGSATPSDTARHHSGAGRILNVTMRTMTLTERLELKPTVGLEQLLAGEKEFQGASETTVSDLAEWVVAGGWPGWSGRRGGQRVTESYIDQLIEHDVQLLTGNRRDPVLMRAFLRAYAAAIAQPMSMANIRRRMGEVLDREPDQATPMRLHDSAQQVFLIEDLPGWSVNLRSKSATLQTPKRQLADVSLACALLGAGPDQLLGDPATFGHMFEAQVVHDVRVFAQHLRARGVFHLRDSTGRDEIDLVVESRNGNWVGFEVKLSHQEVEKAAANLVRVAAKVPRSPANLAVIIPAGRVMRLDNGVHVIPLTCLGAAAAG